MILRTAILMFMSTSLMAQTAPVFLSWKAADVATPQLITAEDLSENNGQFTYLAQMERNKVLNLELDLNDIFSLGAEIGKKLEIKLDGVSDLAPDCAAITTQLQLKGTVTCNAVIGNQTIALDSKSGASNRVCKDVPRTIYETQKICEVPECPDAGSVRPFSLARAMPCTHQPVCRYVKVAVGMVNDRVCEESNSLVKFRVDGFASSTATQIKSFLSIDSATETSWREVNGLGISSVKLLTNLTNTHPTVTSKTFFSLVCANNQVIGTSFTKNQSIFYADILQACGTTGSVFLRSNRPLLFDTSSIFLIFEKPY